MVCPHLDAAARYVHDFAEMLHHLRGDELPDWMERVLADDLPALHSLGGLRRDFDAVIAGLSTPWSSGQVEGHVTRVKLLKRMAYDRANLDLLRQRVLLAHDRAASQHSRQSRMTRNVHHTLQMWEVRPVTGSWEISVGSPGSYRTTSAVSRARR